MPTTRSMAAMQHLDAARLMDRLSKICAFESFEDMSAEDSVSDGEASPKALSRVSVPGPDCKDKKPHEPASVGDYEPGFSRSKDFQEGEIFRQR